MTFRISPQEAVSAMFRKDWWLVVKIPVSAYLAWSFFLPQLWKVGVLLITSIVSTFLVGSPAGSGVSNFHMYFMFGAMVAVIYGVFWYTVYVFAYLGRPGMLTRTVGVAGVLIHPILLIGVALLIGGLGTLLGVPQEQFWAYLDKWTPIESWRVIQP
jgi:hypothetical protein